MRRITTLALLPAAALVLTACGSSDDQPAGAASVATQATTGPSSPGTTSESTDSAQGTPATSLGDAMLGTPADVGGPYGELRDGVWTVGRAGEVEFRVTGFDTLELVDVRLNDGWNVQEQEVESDKIDIDFRQGPVDYEIEIAIDDGVLEVEIDHHIDPAEGGTFAVGEAATVDVAVENGRPGLGDVSVTDGWSDVSRDSERGHLALEFRRDGTGFVEAWELWADVDRGELEIRIDYKIEGAFPR